MTLVKPLVITAGEPAGIGPELCLSLPQSRLAHDVVVISDPDLLQDLAARLDVDIIISAIDPDDVGRRRGGDNELLVLAERFHVPTTCGSPDPANASALLAGLRRAVAGCVDGSFAGLVTAPLQKSVINDAGIAFSGHTEFLAELTGSHRPVMLLVAGDLRVALASTHMPLRAVPDYLTADGLREVIEILHEELRSRFSIDDPQIVVCGLNPHAGEGGHLGSEDLEIIAPVIEELAARGWAIRGPLPADTAFTPAAGPKDAVVAMYHDQGLPVLKYAGFGSAVNVTLGLPIVRTSVDHGTALDIAGKGIADPGSLCAAVELATRLAST